MQKIVDKNNTIDWSIWEDLWKDLKARYRCIEVLYRPDKEKDDKILTKVYFDFDPQVYYNNHYSHSNLLLTYDY